MKLSNQLTDDEYMALIDQYAASTLTGMLALSTSQEDFTADDLHQICDTSFIIAKWMIAKRDAVVQERMGGGMQAAGQPAQPASQPA